MMGEEKERKKEKNLDVLIEGKEINKIRDVLGNISGT